MKQQDLLAFISYMYDSIIYKMLSLLVLSAMNYISEKLISWGKLTLGYSVYIKISEICATAPIVNCKIS